MPTVSLLPLYLRVLILALPILVLGCGNTDQRKLRMHIEQNHPFEVRWKRADPRPIESEEELIDSVIIDTGSKIVKEKRDVLVVRSIPLDDVAISKLKRELLDSGLFELKLHPSLVLTGSGFTEIAISCNRVDFELRLYDRESTDPPELIQNTVDVVSKITAAIQELSSAESN
jgi:hypothetical protein